MRSYPISRCRGWTGSNYLKKVRKSFGSIPFVLFTGRGREEVVIEAINNGVDFYLQKGGDPKAQFAELAHKVRQAVTRRRAEIALSDSEKRLADIINFLPDATFAIDTRGVVIAWNRAMERMTGVSSQMISSAREITNMHSRFTTSAGHCSSTLSLTMTRRLLNRYPFVKKEGRTLFSEITIPHFNEGRGAALWFTASPLYQQERGGGRRHRVDPRDHGEETGRRETLFPPTGNTPTCSTRSRMCTTGAILKAGWSGPAGPGQRSSGTMIFLNVSGGVLQMISMSIRRTGNSCLRRSGRKREGHRFPGPVKEERRDPGAC